MSTPVRKSRISAHLVAIALCSIQAAYSSAQDSYNGWENLSKITHDTQYSILEKDRSCYFGKIVQVSESSLQWRDLPTQTNRNPATRTIQRSDIVLISESGASIHDSVFSGRSSWNSLKEAAPKGPREYLLIVSKSSDHHKSKKFVVNEDSIVLQDSGKDVAIAKSNVAQVYYVRVKPATDNEKYLAQEAPFLWPKFWFGPLFFTTLPVLLYDASMPENNTPLTCKADN